MWRCSPLLLLACTPSELPFDNTTTPCVMPTDAPLDPSYDPQTMLCVDLRMPESEFREMAAQQRWGESERDLWEGVVDHVLTDCSAPFPDPFTWFEADVTVEGHGLTSVGIRKKGFVGSSLESSRVRPSIKLDLDRLVEGQQLGDTERITLNNNLTDPTRVHACLAYSVFRDAGYPAPRCNLANVMLDGASLGAYTHVEPIKKRFLRRAFGNDAGDLYECTIADVTLDHLEEGPGRWEPKTSETDATGEPLRRVARALQVPDDDLDAELDRVLDVDRFITFWALETLVSHNDGYCGNSNNTYVYFDPDDENRATFIPWGPDDAFQGRATAGFLAGEVCRRLADHPDFNRRYEERLGQLLDAVWDEDTLIGRIDDLAALSATAEPNNTGAIDELKTYIEDQRAQVEALIADGVDVPPDPRTCYDAADGLLDGLAELVEVAAYGCDATPGRHAFGLSWLRRRR